MSRIHYENHMPLLMRIIIGGWIFVLIKVNDSRITDYIDCFCQNDTADWRLYIFLKG